MTTEIVLVLLGLMYLNDHSIRSFQDKNSKIELFIDHPFFVYMEMSTQLFKKIMKISDPNVAGRIRPHPSFWAK